MNYGFFGHGWPFEVIKKFFSISSQQTISGELNVNFLNTLGISCFQSFRWYCYAPYVKILKRSYNPQVTKALSTQVDTPETIRLLSTRAFGRPQPSQLLSLLSIHSSLTPNNPPRNNAFNEWLAGLIDGDGCFQLSRKGYASLEITMDIRDEHCLNIVKNLYGGSLKLRSNSNSIRYRLHHKSGLLSLINAVNGLIRNPTRIIQLNKICVNYNITFLFPNKLTYNNGWMAGFFDADGTITINKTNHQLSISISQKTTQILEPLVEIFGGYIYIDRGKYESFKWYITGKLSILSLLEYFIKYPSRSGKKNRIHLIPKFYELKFLKAHNAPENSKLSKSWTNFLIKWDRFAR